MGKSFHLSEPQFAHMQRLEEGGGGKQRGGSGGGSEKEGMRKQLSRRTKHSARGCGGSLEKELGETGLWADLGKLPLPPSSGATTTGTACPRPQASKAKL